MIQIEYDGSTYEVDPADAYAEDLIVLPGGVVLRVTGWEEASPPRPVGLERVHAAAARTAGLDTTDGAVVWRGTLATGGRTPEPFAASITVSAEGTTIYGHSKRVAWAVSPHEVRADSWLPLLGRVLAGLEPK